MAESDKSTTIATTVDHNHTRSEFTASDEDPPAPTTASEKEDPAAAADTDCWHQTKKRKKCPVSLNKIQEFAPLNQSFSFTFDTKSTACAPEITPKFGSFNSGKDSTPLIAKNHPAKVLESQEESVGEGSEVREETVGVLIDNLITENSDLEL